MKTVNICMSGGRTSAYLTEKVLELQFLGKLTGIKFVILFANTGREHDKTLEFVHKCSERWKRLFDNSVVWLEAVVHEDRIPCSHKIVDFDSACRDGKVFEDVVAKYGLPNGNFLHCTRELKENPILSYMESIGEKKGFIKKGHNVSATYETWIGIRADEPKRLGGNRNGKQFKAYPLAEPITEEIDLSCDKQDVLTFWEDMPFNLELTNESSGNCVVCHKKSNRKLHEVFRNMPEEFEFSKMLDEKYTSVKPQVLPDGEIKHRKRFRGYMNTNEMIASFDLMTFNPKNYDEESGGCSESCEPFMLDNTPDE